MPSPAISAVALPVVVWLLRVLPTAAVAAEVVAAAVAAVVAVVVAAISVQTLSWKSLWPKGYSTLTPKALQNKFCK